MRARRIVSIQRSIFCWSLLRLRLLRFQSPELLCPLRRMRNRRN